MKDLKPSPPKRVPDETYLGDTETAAKIVAARRAARRGQPLEPAKWTAPNLRGQVLALLESRELADLLAWAQSDRVPHRVKVAAYELEIRRRLILEDMRSRT